jgi:hypothetical protein
VTTTLFRSLAREVLLDGQAYKVVISPTGVRLTAKGHRKGAELSWETLLALGEVDRVASPPDADRTDLPQAIAADVAREVRTAKESLGRAAAVLAQAGSLPASVLATVEPDPVYGRPEHDAGWFIEPLLTVDEVASILRISRAGVARLPIRSVSIVGERRYRQSEIRRYLVSATGT